mgnify:CR=1 FL=1
MDNTLETHLDTLLEEFEIECDSNLNLYATSLQLYIEHSDLFSETMRNMIVEYAILKLFGKWEKFLEDIFIEYMLGGCSRNGQIVNRYVSPVDREHAYKMIQNVNLYPDWSDVEKVLTNARNFFENGGSFKILKTVKAELTSFKKVRNSIAHISIRAKRDFENLVQGKVGYLPDGITPAKFLIEFKTGRERNAPTYCEHYIAYLKNTAKMLVEYSPEET